MASSTKKEKIINSISPAALVAIVIMNLLLIYTNYEILLDIEENTEIALNNQEIGLNVSSTNHDMLERILQLQGRANQTLLDLNAHMYQTNETLRQLNISDLS